MEGYRLPPVMFTREEASSFVTAEKLVQQFTDASLGKHFQTAMAKIRSVLKGQEKEWVAMLDQQVWVNNARQLFNKEIPNAMEILMNSLASQTQSLLGYRSQSSEQITERHIEPVGLYHEYDRWYLFAWCTLRNEYRQFRTDRICYIKPTSIPFAKQHNTLDYYRSQQGNCDAAEVRITVKKEVLPYLDATANYYGLTEQLDKAEETELVFRTDKSMKGLARWYLMFGDAASVLSPPSFKQLVKELAQKTLQNLSCTKEETISIE